MPEPKNPDVRTLAVRVSPDFHAQLSMVAQVDEMSLTDLMMKALENHVEARRQAADFPSQGASGLGRGRGSHGSHRAMLLGTLPEGTGETSTDSPATGRGKRKEV
jgi:hypothetical protein